MLIEQLKHFAKGGSGPINDACAQAIDEIERLQEAKRQALHVADERSKENVSLRRTLEQHAVKNRGGPFWRCEYCEAMSQTPIAFKHKPDCIMAGSIAPLQAELPYGEVLDEMDHEAKYQPATNYAEANPIAVVTLAQFLHDDQPIMLGGRSQPLSVYKEFARLILSEFILRRKPPA